MSTNHPTCRVRDCNGSIQGRLVYCSDHWHMLPPGAQNLIKNTFGPNRHPNEVQKTKALEFADRAIERAQPRTRQEPEKAPEETAQASDSVATAPAAPAAPAAPGGRVVDRLRMSASAEKTETTASSGSSPSSSARRSSSKSSPDSGHPALL